MASLGRVELATVDVIAAIPRCRDCRWWDREHEATGRNPGSMRVDPMLTGDSGACLITETHSLDAEHTESKAVVWEGDSYHGVLVTAADFGCVQFEPRGGEK